MKTIKNKYLLAILFFASISACKKFDTTITLNAPDIANVIVVNSLFNNDSLLQVNISRSKNYFTKDSTPSLTAAVCKLYANGNYVENLTYVSNGNYIASIKPIPTATYEIKVSAANYANVNAVAQLPALPQLVEAQTYFDTTSYHFYYTVNDVETTKNYYGITLCTTYIDSLGNTKKGTFQYPVSPYKKANENSQGFSLDFFGSGDENSGLDFYFDDNLFNNSKVSGDLDLSEYKGWLTYADSGKVPPPLSLQVVITNMSQNMYKYKSTVAKQNGSNGNPFAEPVSIYTNVDGGLGIFAGYTIKTYIVKLK